MQRSGLALFALFLTLACAGVASPKEAVSTVASARELPLAAFDGHHEFAFEGQLVSISGGMCVLFDETGGESLTAEPEQLRSFSPGDTCRVSGVLKIDADRDRHFVVRAIDRTGSRPLPPVCELSAAEIGAAANRYRSVRACGVVERVYNDELDRRYLWFVVRTASGLVTASIPEACVPIARLEQLVDAEVEVCARVTPYSSLRRHLGSHLALSNATSLHVLSPARADPFSAPPYRATDDLHRRLVTGRVLAASSDRFFMDAGEWDPCLQIRLLPSQRPPTYGRRVSAVGFTHRAPTAMLLACAAYRDEGEASDAADDVRDVELDALFRDADNRDRMDSSCNGKLIRLSGIVRRRADSERTASLVSERHDVLVDFTSDGLRDVGSLEDGARVEVTGLCIAESADDGTAVGRQRFVGFTLFPRRPDDVRVLARPPWWTPRRLLAALVVAGLLIVAILVWNGSLRILAERRGRELAAGNVARAEADMRMLERTRLGVELHDSIAQNLTLASFEITSAQQLVPETEPELLHRLQIAGRTVMSCNCDLRNCIWDLHNEALDQVDMEEAIRRTLLPHVRDVRVLIRFNVPRERLTDTTTHVLLRIIRELAVNAIRHGHATEIRIAGGVESGSIVFSVRDNGCGFDPERRVGIQEGHFGLEGILERTRQFGGRMSIESSLGSGTRVVVRLAVRGARAEMLGKIS